MNATEAIDKIVRLLKLQFKKENFSSTFLTDGTEVTNNMSDESEFEVGQTLFVVKESTLAPAPEGSHETREGLILSLDSESTIIAIASKDTDKTEVSTMEETEKEDEDEEGKEKKELSEETIVSEIAEIIDVMTPDEVSTGEAAKIADKIYGEVEKLLEESEGEFSELEEKITEEIAEIIDVMTPDAVSTEKSAEIAEKIVNDLEKEMEEDFRKKKKMYKKSFSKDIKDIKSSMTELISLINEMNGKFKTDINKLNTKFDEFKKSPERKAVEEKKTYKQTFEDYKLDLIKSLRNK